jgi:hypothetical protein
MVMRGFGLGIGITGLGCLTGCFQTPTTSVQVAPLRVATVVLPAAATVTAGHTTKFTAQADGEPAGKVAWRVLEPGGGSVDAAGLYQAPAVPGVYTVQGAFEAANGQTAAAKVTVVAPPAGAILAPARVLAGAAEQKAGIAPVPGSTYLWTVTGGSITSGTDTPDITFLAGTGPKVVLSCQVTNAGGTVLNSSLEVPVAAPVSLSITPAAVTITAERTMKFGFDITGGISLGVVWSLGEPGAGRVDAAGNYVAPAVPGLYTVRATSQDDPAAIATAQVKVVAQPPQSLTAPGSFQPGAQGLRAMVPEVAGMTYAWTLDGGTITSGADAPTVVFQAGDGPTLALSCTVTNEAGDTFVARQVLKAQ